MCWFLEGRVNGEEEKDWCWDDEYANEGIKGGWLFGA